MNIPTRQQVENNYHTRSFLKSFSVENISAGLISGILAITGPALLILEASREANFTHNEIMAWLFAVYVFGGLLSIVLPVIYKMPITGAHSITGAAFLVTVAPYVTFSELVGAYVLSGLIMFIIGFTGAFSKIMEWFPNELIAAMLAGVIIQYVLRLVPAIQALPIVGIAGLIGFFLIKAVSDKIPPIVGAIILSSIALLFTVNIQIEFSNASFFVPTMFKPEFSLTGLLTLSLPLALLVLSNDAAQGIGSLRSFGFEPKTKMIISISGVTSMIAGFFGGHCANLAGMMTAICAGEDSGVKSNRYIASIVSGLILLLFGLFSRVLITVIQAVPVPFITMIAGFSLIGVLSSSLQTGFSNPKFQLSTLTAFVIALSNISLLNISAPVWALLLGAIVLKLNKS